MQQHVLQRSLDWTRTKDGATRPIRASLTSLRVGEHSSKRPLKQNEVLEDVKFPRKEEWLLSHFLSILSSNATDRSVSEIGEAWTLVNDYVHRISPQRVRVLLRRTDMISLLSKYLNTAQENEASKALPSITATLTMLLGDRATRRVLLCNLEDICNVIFKALDISTKSRIAIEALLYTLMDILNFTVTHRYTAKRLIDTIHHIGFAQMLRYMASHGSFAAISPIIQRLFHENLSTNDVVQLRHSLAKCVDVEGLDCLCLASFQVVSARHSTNEKLLEQRNKLLGLWLSTVHPGLRSSTLRAYKVSSLGQVLARPLSSDPSISVTLKSIVQDILGKAKDTASIVLLLETDVDLLLPEHEVAIWQMLEASQSDRLAIALLTSFVEIRELPQFLTKFLAMAQADALLTHEFLNLVAQHFSMVSPVTQQETLNAISMLHSSTSDRLLCALFKGVQKESITKQLMEDMIANSRFHAKELQSAIFLEANKSQVPEPILCLERISVNECLSSTDATTWLRSVELHVDAEQSTSAQIPRLVDALLALARQDSPFLSQIIDRWLPSLINLLNQEQCKTLATILCSSTSSTGSTLSVPYLCHNNVLEAPKLHQAIQEELLTLQFTGNREILSFVPLDFFHRAARRELLFRSVNLSVLLPQDLQLLIKFAHHGMIYQFQQAEEYLRFVRKTITPDVTMDVQPFVAVTETIPEQTQHTADLLRRKYMKSFSLEYIRNLLEADGIPPVLLIEILEELAGRKDTDLDLYHSSQDVAVAWCCAELSSNLASEDMQAKKRIYTTLDLLLRLVKCDNVRLGQRITSALYNIGPEQDAKPDVPTVLLQLIQNDLNNDYKRVSLELLAWTCCSTAQAQIVADLVNFNDVSIHLVARLSQAWVNVLPLEDIHQWLRLQLDSRSHSKIMMLMCTLYELAARLRSEYTLQTPWLLYMAEELCSGPVIVTLLETNADLLRKFVDLLDVVMQSYAKVITTFQVDHFLSAILHLLESSKKHPDTGRFLVASQQVLNSVFLNLSPQLRERYHLVVQVFQTLLQAIFEAEQRGRKKSIEMACRLLDTFIESSRASTKTPDMFNKAFSKHLPWLLIEYIDLSSRSVVEQSFDASEKQSIEEGMIYQCLNLCSIHERELVGVSLDSGKRGLFKKILEEWQRFGKWNER